MATATVTLKVTPNETQIIAEALRMYAYACRGMSRENRKHPLDGFKMDLSIGGNDIRRLAMTAAKIREDIGLK